jgi:hypothetical protein
MRDTQKPIARVGYFHFGKEYSPIGAGSDASLSPTIAARASASGRRVSSHSSTLPERSSAGGNILGEKSRWEATAPLNNRHL